MKFLSKGICATVLLATSISAAHAQMVNFELEGTVYNTNQNNYWYGNNPFGLEVGDTITASAVFDDSLISATGLSVIDFDSADIEMFITVGNTVYTDDDDFSGGAWLWFDDGYFDGLSYSSNDWEFDSSSFCCDFNGYDFDGQWTSLSMSPVSAVPVPAAVWLFGSGLIGLVGLARRKAS